MPETDQQADQATLADALAQQLPAAWGALLDIDDLEPSLPGFIAGVSALVHTYGRTSGAIAARYYQAARDAAGISGKVTIVPAKPPVYGELDTGIRWATKGLWSEDPDIDAAQSLVQGVAERATLDVGRNTLLEAIHRDRHARGWARVVEPGACSFCIMLATRGAVYRQVSGNFRAHNNCRCTLEPIFGPWEPSAQMRQWQALYKSSTRGLSGAGARRAFRQAVGSS